MNKFANIDKIIADYELEESEISLSKEPRVYALNSIKILNEKYTEEQEIEKLKNDVKTFISEIRDLVDNNLNKLNDYISDAGKDQVGYEEDPVVPIFRYFVYKKHLTRLGEEIKLPEEDAFSDKSIDTMLGVLKIVYECRFDWIKSQQDTGFKWLGNVEEGDTDFDTKQHQTIVSEIAENVATIGAQALVGSIPFLEKFVPNLEKVIPFFLGLVAKKNAQYLAHKYSQN